MDNILLASSAFPEVAFDAADILIREGDAHPNLYVLVSGTLAVYRGDIRVSRTSTPGAIFGEMSALLGIPSSASVIAETAVRAIRIEDSQAFLSSRPEIALHAARLLAQRLYDATTYLADLKRQFESEENHLGMVDRILGSLLNQQLQATENLDRPEDDSRL